MRLNHVANRVREGTLELILELFTTRLHFVLLRRIPTDIWLRQNGRNVDIQFCETPAANAPGDKHNSHISFLSEDPEQGRIGVTVQTHWRVDQVSKGSLETRPRQALHRLRRIWSLMI